MAVANPASPCGHLLRLACAWPLILAVGSCSGNSAPTTNCPPGETCDPSDQNPGDGSGGTWETVDLLDFQAQYSLLPRGTFVFKAIDSDSAQLVANNADDSLVTATIDATGNATDWRIWHGEMYYKVEYTEIGAGTSKHWGFITGALETPGGSVASPKTLELSTPYGGTTTASVSDMTPLLEASLSYASFVNASTNQDAVFEKDDVVAGVPCKKYVYSTDYGKDEWWILDNGFCLKHQFTSNGQVVAGFETIQAELDTPTYDYVTQTYGTFANQVDVAPPVDSMLRIVDAISDDVWTAPAEFVPWTAGGINLMVVIRAVNKNTNPVFQVFFTFPEGTSLAAATEDYQTRILLVPGMELLDGYPLGADEFGYVWKYSNSASVTCDNGSGFVDYQVSTVGSSGPSTPAQITIVYTDLVCV